MKGIKCKSSTSYYISGFLFVCYHHQSSGLGGFICPLAASWTKIFKYKANSQSTAECDGEAQW